MINIKEITSIEDFKNFKDSTEFGIVKISASWCGPCRVLEGVIKNLDPSKIGNSLFAEVDVDEDYGSDIAEDYNVTNIPVLLYFKGGELVGRTVGLTSAEDIINNINTLS